MPEAPAVIFVLAGMKEDCGDDDANDEVGVVEANDDDDPTTPLPPPPPAGMLELGDTEEVIEDGDAELSSNAFMRDLTSLGDVSSLLSSILSFSMVVCVPF